MEVKMIFEKKTPMYQTLPGDSIIIELRGDPILVEILRELIVDFFKKQEGFKKHY